MRGVGEKTPRNRVFLANKENYAVEMTVGPVGFTVFTKFSIFSWTAASGSMLMQKLIVFTCRRVLSNRIFMIF